MIVLTNTQKDIFNGCKLKYETIFDSRNVDIVPIEIQNGLWILPEEILINECFKELMADLTATGFLSTLVFRTILENEIITINPIN